MTPLDWEAAVARDLNGRPAESLNWTTEDGITVKPLYASADLAGMEPRELYSSRSWKIGCEVSDLESARHAVSRGAMALYVERGDIGSFEGIEVLRADSPNLIRADDDTAAAELASLLRKAAAQPAASAIEVPIGLEYFIEIAKFRAARLLWPRVSQTPLRILARTSKHNRTIYDPYVNLLRGTTEAMSAIIGGCDILVIRPFDVAYEHPGEFSRRLSINTQLLLRDEACFREMPDPAAGCYYIEWLTAALAKKAWELFETGQPAPSEPRPRVFVGVNKYADPNDRALPRLKIEPDAGRAAWRYEKERLDAERQP